MKSLLAKHRLLFVAAITIGVGGLVVSAWLGAVVWGLALLVPACMFGTIVHTRRSQQHVLTAVQESHRRMEFYAKQTAASSHAAVLLAQRFPDANMPVSSFSMNPINVMALVDVLEEVQPARIVELGSGISTLVMASWLKERGKGHLISFDHDEGWCRRCQRHLDLSGAADYADVFATSLVPTDAFGRRGGWYDLAQHEHELREIDLLVIDGPPAGDDPLARVPALDYFYARLTDKAAVLLDDGARTGEQAVIAQWAESYPNLKTTFLKTMTGCFIIRTDNPVCGSVADAEARASATVA